MLISHKMCEVLLSHLQRQISVYFFPDQTEMLAFTEVFIMAASLWSLFDALFVHTLRNNQTVTSKVSVGTNLTRYKVRGSKVVKMTTKKDKKQHALFTHQL